MLAQRLGEDVADVVAPEVLVLDVDQPPGPFEGLGVATGDAALAAVGERVVALRAAGRGRCAAAGRRGCRRRPAAAGGACSGSGSGVTSIPASRSLAQRSGLRLSGVGSTHRSRNTVSTSKTAGPLIAAWMSCHGGVSPYSFARIWGCGSPWWSASSRRAWQRSIPPTYAMSRVGSSRWRMTSIFWWCEPPNRTRMSSRASAPRRWSRLPRRRFSSEVKPRASRCERQTRPRTSTPRSSARPSTAETSLPGSPISRSSASPCQSVKSTRSPSRVASSRSYSSA